MAKIALVTDTNSSLPADLARKSGITLVPIHIQFGEETYITGQDIDDTKLFEIIDATNKLPTTAAPSPEAFRKAFEETLSQGSDEIICICCSSKASATYNAALVAAEQFPEGQISVFDSLQLSLAEGFQVLEAEKMIQAGEKREAIIAHLEDWRPKIHVFAALPTLKYLVMGGRMGRLTAGLANTLNIKPVLTTMDGKLELLEKVRTWRKARERLVELASNCTAGKSVQQLGLVHVNNKEGALALHKMLSKTLDYSAEPLVAEFTPGLSVHAGSGVIGFVVVTH